MKSHVWPPIRRIHWRSTVLVAAAGALALIPATLWAQAASLLMLGWLVRDPQ